MEVTYTLAEAMKKLKIILKTMQSQSARITSYASKLSNEKPQFESDEAQKREVMALIQSNEDLAKQYLSLKVSINYTNIVTKVTLAGETFRVDELLHLKRTLGQQLMYTYRALTEDYSRPRLRGNSTADGKSVFVERMYDEKMKNEKIRHLQEQLDEITTRLETINATTPLIWAPEL